MTRTDGRVSEVPDESQSPPGLFISVLFHRIRPDSPWPVRLWHSLFRPKYTHVALRIGGLVLDFPARGEPYWSRLADYVQDRPPTHEIEVTITEPSKMAGLILAEVCRWRTNRVASAWYVLTGIGSPCNCASAASVVLKGLGLPIGVAYTPDELESELCQVRPSSLRRLSRSYPGSLLPSQQA